MAEAEKPQKKQIIEIALFRNKRTMDIFVSELQNYYAGELRVVYKPNTKLWIAVVPVESYQDIAKYIPLLLSCIIMEYERIENDFSESFNSLKWQLIKNTSDWATKVNKYYEGHYGSIAEMSADDGTSEETRND